MTYLIEEANVLKENKVEQCSIVVKDTNIDYISNSITRFNFMRMNLSNYLLTPGHVMMNFSFANNLPFHEFKETMKTHYLQKGCTTVIVICDVSHERELKNKIEKTRHYLLNSPIDFYIGVKISLKALTPSFIRACKKMKIPVVIVDINNEQELLTVPWGWIKEAFHPYFFPLIPRWQQREKSIFNGNKHIHLWEELMSNHGIPTVNSCPEEHVPLSMDLLKKMGIYPAKGDIRIRGMLDYNLYQMEEMSYSVEGKPMFDYNLHTPTLTMHKGKFLKVGAEVFFYPGFGSECKVILPGHFVSSR
ncbi:hypothetical protein [Bacillus sp. PS06]|uniref:hypothetical protein n=1 Tax=Bacillus sp. PS06 TaxID=2764176 RepID=UPI00177D8A9D|nr:hypothetical protein [Bacillus sp. PS06]MBD8070239.1 hypothetical protein [Bacillus sp. PS06]